MKNIKLNIGCGWFLSLLTLIFITLKLCEVIDWSWWLVLLPIIIGSSISGLIILMALGMLGFVLYSNKFPKKLKYPNWKIKMLEEFEKKHSIK